MMAGRYSQGVPNLDIYLKGHSGGCHSSLIVLAAFGASGSTRANARACGAT